MVDPGSYTSTDRNHTVIAGITDRLVRLRAHEVDEGIRWSLNTLGSELELDRVCLYLTQPHSTTARLSYVWQDRTVPPKSPASRTVDLQRDFPWFFKNEVLSKAYTVEDVASLPADASTEREFLLQDGILSLLFVPLRVQDRLLGFIEINTVKRLRMFTKPVRGLIEEFAEILIPILERKEYDRHLRQQRRSLANIIEGTNAGTWIWNVQTGETVFNERWAEMLGYSLDELQPIGIWTWESLTHPDDLILAEGLIENHFLGKSAYYNCEVRMRHKQGHWVWIHDRGQVFSRTKEGRPLMMFGTHMDITDRKEAEQQLAASERRYRQMFETNKAIKLIIDPEDGRILDANPAAVEFYGFERQALLSMKITDVNVLPEEEVHLEMERARKEDRLFFEFRHKLRSGEIREVEVFSGPVDEGGRTLLYSVVFDVTERKRIEQERLQLERQVQQAQKLESLGVLAGGIAHDFNNILMAILGYSEIALLDLPEGHPVVEYVEEIRNGAKRAADLTRQMLAYAGKGRYSVGMIDLTRLLGEIAHLLRASIPRNIALEVNLPPSLPLIRADSELIQQVFLNLVSNAAEAIGEDSGVITLTGGIRYCDEPFLAKNLAPPSHSPESPQPGDYVYIRVEDNGCGMDQETKNRLFEPFFTTKFTGRGLGMSAVQGILRKHQGAILLETQPGVGSSFEIFFPLAESLERSLRIVERMVPAVVGETAARLAGGAILVVDDEEPVRRLVRNLLERWGYRVFEAANGLEAVEVFRMHRNSVEVVLLDLTMPLMGGEECFAEMRKIKENIPVVLASGYSQREVIERFSGLGFSGFIKKPYEAEDLKKVLQEMLALLSSNN